jgi:hypothetical protein
MGHSMDTYELIEHYLSGEMTSSEKADFELSLKNSEELRKKFQVVKASTLAVKSNRLHQFNDLVSATRVKREQQAKTKKYALVASSVLLIATTAAVLFNVFQNKKDDVVTNNSNPSLAAEPLVNVDDSIAKPSKVEGNIVSIDSDISETNSSETEVEKSSPKKEIQNTQTLKEEKATPVTTEVPKADMQKEENSASTDNGKKETPEPKTAPKAVVDCDKVSIQTDYKVKNSCDDQSDGTIQLSPIKGGDAPYTLKLNGKSISNFLTINDLGVGEYNLQITDKNQCVKQFDKIKVGQMMCKLDFDFNPNRGESWSGPSMASNFNMSIYDKNGRLIYQKTFESNQNSTWDGKDNNNQSVIGYHLFILQGANNQLIKGSITVTQ